jgi:tRNA A64-2'-O-ribosylphosphate transferase
MSDGNWWLPSDQFARSDAELRQLGHALRKDERRAEKASLLNHMRSIDNDARYVRRLLAKFDLREGSVFANLRCGSWYVQPPCGTTYFKSTDGHYGKWAFSLRRLNLHLAAAAVDGSGAAVVDATRSGKLYPDSLSKTVPIWCCVVSRALALLSGAQPPPLLLPPWVPLSERSAIEGGGSSCGGINEWTQQLLLTSRATLLQLLRRHAAAIVLRPVWACPDDSSAHVAWAAAKSEGCIPILCVSCSSAEPPPHTSWTFIQGAGDDEEHWAAVSDSCALTHALWWKHRPQLLACLDDDDAASTILHIASREIVQDEFASGVKRLCDGMVLVCAGAACAQQAELQEVTCAINISADWTGWSHVLQAPHVACLHAHVTSPKENKTAVKVALLSRLPAIASFVTSIFVSDAAAAQQRPCIAILCDGPGMSAAVAVAAALPLVLPVLDVWGLREEPAASAVTKGDVRRVLANVSALPSACTFARSTGTVFE